MSTYCFFFSKYNKGLKLQHDKDRIIFVSVVSVSVYVCIAQPIQTLVHDDNGTPSFHCNSIVLGFTHLETMY